MIKLVKVAKVAQARSHSDKPGNHGLRNAVDRYLAKGGNGGGGGGGGGGGKPNGGGDDGVTSSTCSFLGNTCCEGPKVKGRKTYICDTTYISNLECTLEGVCAFAPGAQLDQTPVPPQCVTSRCGEPLSDSGCESDDECPDGAVCDTCGPTTCQSIGQSFQTCEIPGDFDDESFWPCCGTCDGQCCKIASSNETYC